MKLTTKQVYAVAALSHAVKLLNNAYSYEFFEHLVKLGAMPSCDFDDLEAALDCLIERGEF